MAILGQKSDFLVRLTIYVELEWHMISQNDRLNETDKKSFSIFFGHFDHLELKMGPKMAVWAKNRLFW